MFTRHSLTASAKIIVNLHIGAVVKVKLGRKAMQPGSPCGLDGFSSLATSRETLC